MSLCDENGIVWMVSLILHSREHVPFVSEAYAV